MTNISHALPLIQKCFVVGPIGDKDAKDGTSARSAYEEGIQLYEEVIGPACNFCGFEAVRADMIARSGEIPEQIFRQLRDSPVVIADLTGANPNVMYELGLRHTTGKLTIQIGERDRLPFDVAAIRTIMFRRTPAGLVQARRELVQALISNLDTGGDPVTATRIWFEAPSGSQQRQEEPPVEMPSFLCEKDDDAPGFLELLAEMETGNQTLVQTMAAATSIMQDIGTIFTDATEGLRKADSRGGGAAARLIIAEQTAKKLDEQAAKLEVVSGEYANTVDRIEPGIKYLLGRLAEEPAQLAEVPDFPLQVRALCDAAQSSIEGSLNMRANGLEIGKASRSLRRAGQRLAPSFKRLADTSSRIANWKDLIDKIL